MKSLIKFLLPLGLYLTILAVNHPSLGTKTPEIADLKTSNFIIVNSNIK